MTDKFTPGPWEYSLDGETRKITSPDGEFSMCDETYYPWIDGTEGDWYLIAAAPELYAALEGRSCADQDCSGIKSDNPCRDCIDTIALLKKARGER